MKAFLSLCARRLGAPLAAIASLVTLFASHIAFAQGNAMMAQAPVGEDSLVVPTASFATAQFAGGVNGQQLLMLGFGVCFAGLAFGLVVYSQLKNAPVHKSMLEVSELIYETCKTYLFTQLKFIAVLEAFIAVVVIAYYGVIKHESAANVVIILLFSVIGIAGSSTLEGANVGPWQPRAGSQNGKESFRDGGGRWPWCGSSCDEAGESVTREAGVRERNDGSLPDSKHEER